MLVVSYLFIMMAGFFVYGIDCFNVNNCDYVFCLMVVVGFLFMVVAEFLC